ncbi:MAG: MFS transporter [Candidatus Rokuibacteriota bacterium]|nr:MAG: MFS transporter [Candidatus Rokubacteria bacterium]
MFFGWKIVVVAFVIAFFAFGIGFYSLGIYLVALNARHGWPIAFISLAITVYYVLGASLTAFVGDAFERFGPCRVVSVAVGALGLGVLALPLLERPWQLFVAFGVMAVGWAATSGAAINTLVAPWFDRKRGLAVSIAMNGAAAGGVVIVPLWATLIAARGFATAALVMVGAMMLIVLPLIARYLHRGPEVMGLRPDGAMAGLGDPARRPETMPALPRRELLRSIHFWTISAPFALGLLAQVGFITHQVAYLTPRLGAERAALTLSLTTLAAIIGRLATGVFIDRVDRRLACAANLAVQAVAVVTMIGWPSPSVLYVACALFGLGVGNMTTFPGLVVQVEYPKEHFSRVVSFVVAINQFTFAFGPGLLGAIRDWSGSYTAALAVCVGCEVVAAIVIVMGRRRGP